MIVMTHSFNYGGDRIANHVILKSFEFLNQWTNLEFVTEEPMAVGSEYFRRYPDERVLKWQVEVLINPSN